MGVIQLLSIWIKRLSNLFCVKSIVTIVLTGVFAYLSVTGKISSQDFLTIFSVVVAFYFGTQSQRLNDKVVPESEQKKTSPPNET